MLHRIKKFSHKTFHSLVVRNFRLYYFAQGISLSGTWMQNIGQSWLILKLTGSGTDLGLVVSLQYLPVLLLGPFGGVIADRFNKRRLLYVTQSGSGILAFILALLVATNTVQVWMICLLALSLGILNAIDGPTRQTFVHEIVGTERIRNAVTLNSTMANMAKIVGPAIAGILIASVGISTCFFINAASFLGVIACLKLMDEREFAPSEPIKKIKGELIEGFKYVKQTPVVRNILLMIAIIGTLTFEFQVSLPLVAKFTFGTDAGGYAFLMSSIGVGAVLGGLFFASRKTSSPAKLSWAAFAFGAAVIFSAVLPNLIMTAIALVLVGFCSINFTSLGNSTLQLNSDPVMRGRVMALWLVAFNGSTLFGGPIIGWVGEHLDPRWGLIVGGLAALTGGFIGLSTLSKKSKKIYYDEPEGGLSENHRQ